MEVLKVSAKSSPNSGALAAGLRYFFGNEFNNSIVQFK